MSFSLKLMNHENESKKIIAFYVIYQLFFSCVDVIEMITKLRGKNFRNNPFRNTTNNYILFGLCVLFVYGIIYCVKNIFNEGWGWDSTFVSSFAVFG